MIAPPRRAFVALGSNLAHPEQQVRAALARLAELPKTRLIAHSRLYRSPPWGVVEQPPFVNAVAELGTLLSAQELLQSLHALERAAGRVRRERWGPRQLDLDLLCYEGVISEQPALTLPHPHAHERAFVLLPWAELAPEFELPGHGRVIELVARVDCSNIEPLA